MADPFHRKIELQSPDDLQYLAANIRRAADAEIERSLPNLPGMIEERGEDDMRVIVERLVAEYIQTVLKTAASNITINGLPATDSLLESVMSGDYKQVESIEEHEPFDTKADAHSRALLAQEDDLIEEIARLRREVPAKIVEREKNTWREVGETDEATLGGLTQEEGVGVVLKGEMPRTMEENWAKGVKGLEGMVGEGGLTEVVARKERAERAESYVCGRERR